MGFLIKALDGIRAAASPPALPPLPDGVDAALVREAVAFLRRTNLPIEPRHEWPQGGMPQYGIQGKIADKSSGRARQGPMHLG